MWSAHTAISHWCKLELRMVIRCCEQSYGARVVSRLQAITSESTRRMQTRIRRQQQRSTAESSCRQSSVGREADSRATSRAAGKPIDARASQHCA
jgi:hypothetical protein